MNMLARWPSFQQILLEARVRVEKYDLTDTLNELQGCREAEVGR